MMDALDDVLTGEVVDTCEDDYEHLNVPEAAEQLIERDAFVT